MDELKKSFDGVMTAIYEEIIFCDDEIKNAMTDARREQFAAMRKAYLTIVEYYDMESDFQRYKRVTAKFRD